MTLALHSLARLASERVLNDAVAGLMLTFLAWALLRLLPRTNARTRVAVWFSVLTAIPTLSLFGLLLADSSQVGAISPHRLMIPESWALYGFLAWAIVAAVALLRIGFGLWRIRRMRQACSPGDLAALPAKVQEVVTRFQRQRAALLLESKSARVPMAVGFFRPAVILPTWTLQELPASELRAVLLHEFAHLSRWDDWTNLFQKILRSLFFFHPALWWLDRRLALDREMACDDMVLAATEDAHEYARCLVDIAEKSVVRRSLVLAQAAVHHLQHMAARINQILDGNRSRSTRISRLALGSVTGLAAACLIGVLHSPTIIAFEDVAPQLQASHVSRVLPAAVHEHVAARVVPAILREEPHTPAKPRKATVLALKHPQKTDLLASMHAVSDQELKVLQARMPLPDPRLVPVSTMLLVVRDGSITANGEVVWRLSVWQFTVFHPAQAPSREAITAKSI